MCICQHQGTDETSVAAGIQPISGARPAVRPIMSDKQRNSTQPRSAMRRACAGATALLSPGRIWIYPGARVLGDPRCKTGLCARHAREHPAAEVPSPAQSTAPAVGSPHRKTNATPHEAALRHVHVRCIKTHLGEVEDKLLQHRN